MERLFQRVRAFLNRCSAGTILGMGAIALAVIGWADAHLFENISFAIFYLTPVMFVSWFAGRSFGHLAVAAATGVLLIVNVMANSYKLHWLVPVWNALASGVFFSLVVVLLDFLKRQIEHEKARALIDPLTGLTNRRGFYAALKAEILRSRRYRHAFSLAVLDLDDFKAVNDARGHQRGDEVLQAFAFSLKENGRASDVTARLGGDEFALLMPETDAPAARNALDRLHERLNDTLNAQDTGKTVSLGCAAFFAPELTVDDILNKSDLLMYRAKKAGKNRVVYDDVTVVDFHGTSRAAAT